MTGIVGGAGSKSGVIGITELDYEEGVYSPTPNAGSINTTSHNRYKKIGGMCWFECYFGNIQSPGFTYLGGLPFPTFPTGTSYENVSGTVVGNGINWSDGTKNIGVYIYNNNVYPNFQSRDQEGWVSHSGWNSGDDLYFSGYFMCQP